jgi:hypothetical protein
MVAFCRLSHFFFFFPNSAAIELYYYREQDIFLMTDEEGNKNTDMWPSAKNIVRLVPPESTQNIIPADDPKFTVAGDRQSRSRRIPQGCVRILLYVKTRTPPCSPSLTFIPRCRPL